MIEAKEPLEVVLDYAKRQRVHCESQMEFPEYNKNKYSKDGRYTDEQMSGYYVGKIQGNISIIQMIEDILKEKATTEAQRLSNIFVKRESPNQNKTSND